MADDGRKPNGHAFDDSEWQAQAELDDEIRALDKRLGLLAAQMQLNHEIVIGKLDQLLAARDRDKLFRDDVNQRLDAYLTHSLGVEQRVAALEDVATPIESAPKRRKAGRK